MNQTHKKTRLKKVVFLDRDGVINQDSAQYIKCWSEFKFLAGSLKALKKLKDHGFATIVITNQSAVNRKLFTLNVLEDIHTRMQAAIHAAGGHIHDIYFCPHIPEDNCPCRKPKPEMLFEARRNHRIDLASAFMVGDSAKDIECARNAGCGSAILVQTGNGLSARVTLAKKKVVPDHVALDLLDAVDWIVSRS